MKKILASTLITSVLMVGPMLATVQAIDNVPPVDLNKGETPGSTNIDKGAFRLTVCDGPTLPAGVSAPANLGHKYVPCDFNGLMMQIQYLINVMIVVGVFAAMIGFAYAGYLHITGTSSNISKSYEIFKKVGIGFIIMLSAWFIVYQILAWLVSNPAVYLGSG